MATTQKAANIKVLIGKRVRKLRKASGATQKGLADRCGMYRTYISRIENGTANPSLQVLVELADLFEIPLSSLISETPSAPELQGVPLVDRRSLLNFSLNWLHLMCDGDRQNARGLTQYQVQVCAICKSSQLYDCKATNILSDSCALANADTSQFGRTS